VVHIRNLKRIKEILSNSLFLTVKGGLSGALMGDFFSQFPDHSSLYLSDNLAKVSPYLKIALAGFHSIINTRDITQKSWLIQLATHHEDLLHYKNSLTVGQSAIALMPLIVYRHENKNKLEEDLENISKLWLNSPSLHEDLRIWSLFVTLVINNNQIDSQIINQLSRHCQTKTSQQNLQIIKDCLPKKYPLQQLQLKNEIESESLVIYQAIYSFLTIPEYFEISLLKSTQIGEQSNTVAILTGFLLGIYQGYLNIPLIWRKYLELSPLVREEKIDQLSKNFLYTWQGHYCINR